MELILVARFTTATELAQRETIVLDMVDGVGGPRAGTKRTASPGGTRASPGAGASRAAAAKEAEVETAENLVGCLHRFVRPERIGHDSDGWMCAGCDQGSLLFLTT